MLVSPRLHHKISDCDSRVSYISCNFFHLSEQLCSYREHNVQMTCFFLISKSIHSCSHCIDLLLLLTNQLFLDGAICVVTTTLALFTTTAVYQAVKQCKTVFFGLACCYWLKYAINIERPPLMLLE